MQCFWPKRKEWSAQAIPTPPSSEVYGQLDSDANNAWRRDRGRWTNGKNQAVGDWFHLFFDKPRKLSQIEIISEEERFPSKVKFLSKENRISEWKLEEEKEIKISHTGNTVFRHEFRKGQKVEAIKLEIVEPTLEPRNDKGWSPAWAIYDIDVKEYHLWGLRERSIK